MTIVPHLSVVVLLIFLQGAPISCVTLNPSSIEQFASYVDGEANSGTLVGFQNLKDTPLNVNATAIGNDAESRTGVASSGTRLFSAGGPNGRISNSDIDIDNYSVLNKAVSQTNTAVSGSQTVLNEVKAGSTVFEDTYTAGNEATVSGATSNTDPQAIAGQQTQISTVRGNSLFSGRAFASDNQAVNTNTGKAIAGTDNSFGSVIKSDIGLENDAYDNVAVTEDGRAVAGAENSVDTIKQQSKFGTSSYSYQNTATSRGGPAIAGVQNNANAIRDGSIFTSKNIAVDNVAISTEDGKAISGIQTNIGNVKNSDVYIDGYAAGNRATLSGEGSQPRDAVAGTDTTIISSENARVDIAVTAKDNEAYNYDDNPESDAIAGNQVTFGQLENVDLDVYGSAYGNRAYATNGDAVAGNKIELQNVGNNVNDNIVLKDGDNHAESVNGNAIIGSEVILP